MIRLDAATVLLQWAVGGLLPVGHHPPAGGVARLRLAAARHLRADGRSAPLFLGRALRRARCPSATSPAPAWSLATRCRAGRVGPAQGGRGAPASASASRRAARGSRAMTGHRPPARGASTPTRPSSRRRSTSIAPVIGVVGLVAAGVAAGDPDALSVARVVVGRRVPRRRSPTPCSSATGTSCSRACPGARCSSWSAGWRVIWPFEVAVMLWPVGMVVGDHRRRSTTATTASSAGCGSPARSPPSCWSASPGRP